MEKRYGNTDWLTGLNNEIFLNSEYANYLKKYPDSYFVMIDFKKFKRINDIYGHNMGDRYLIAFSEILKAVFDDSLIVRLHGDEFCIVTRYNEDKIIKCIELCNQKIGFIFEIGNIPERFNFNVGLVKAEDDINVTKSKADYMMYYAKRNNQGYQVFDEEIWKVQLEEDRFLTHIAENIEQDSFTYFGKKMLNLSNETTMTEISTRDNLEKPIFSDGNYDLLREKYQLRKIDIHNLNYLLYKISFNVDGTVLINLDYKSLINEFNLIEYLKILIEVNEIKPENIVLSINFNEISSLEIKSSLELINILKRFGFKICIDKYSSLTTDFLWENAFIDFIKVDSSYWKNAFYNIKIAELLDAKLKAFSKYSDVVPLFTSVDDETQFRFINDLGTEDKFVSGDYIEKEQKIKIK